MLLVDGSNLFQGCSNVQNIHRCFHISISFGGALIRKGVRCLYSLIMPACESDVSKIQAVYGVFYLKLLKMKGLGFDVSSNSGTPEISGVLHP